MIKKYIQRWMPNAKQIKSYKALQIFGKLLESPSLLHFNRSSVSRAFAIGLFLAWVPVPFQMLLAAGGAILFNANLAISIMLVWLTNPITMPALFYFAYKVGNFILSCPPKKFIWPSSAELLSSFIQNNWRPFFLGCFICGLISAVLGFFGIHILWRYHLIKKWKQRRKPPSA